MNDKKTRKSLTKKGSYLVLNNFPKYSTFVLPQIKDYIGKNTEINLVGQPIFK